MSPAAIMQMQSNVASWTSKFLLQFGIVTDHNKVSCFNLRAHVVSEDEFGSLKRELEKGGMSLATLGGLLAGNAFIAFGLVLLKLYSELASSANPKANTAANRQVVPCRCAFSCLM
jgi:hypothetical protein